LIIQLLDPAIRHFEQLGVLHANHGLRPLARRREHRKFTDGSARLDADVQFLHQQRAVDDVIHPVRVLALAKQDVSVFDRVPRHERPEPFDGRISRICGFDLLDEAQHLEQAVTVQRQQNDVLQDGRINPGQQTEGDLSNIVRETGNAQRDHRLHGEHENAQPRGHVANAFDECHGN